MKRRLTEEEIDLLIVLEDPIFFSEFMRRTNDGSMERNTWPKDKFTLRSYQREFLTDTTPNIIFMGGRSIGKCQPDSARIWTPDGYKTIRELRQNPSFSVFAVDSDMKATVRRATITYNGLKRIYTVTTNTSKIEVTAEHPFLTRSGWKNAEDLLVGDDIVVANTLPNINTSGFYTYAELRILGYFWHNFNHHYKRQLSLIKPRFNACLLELQKYADQLFMVLTKRGDQGFYRLSHKQGASTLRLTLTALLTEVKALDLTTRRRSFNLAWLFSLSADDIKVFIEALFAQYGVFSKEEIYLTTYTDAEARQLCDLLRIFGIHCVIRAREVMPYAEYTRHKRISAQVVTATPTDARKMWKTFKFPGIGIGQLNAVAEDKINDYFSYEEIRDISLSAGQKKTWAVHVYRDNTYISEHVVVHNSLALEDRIIFNIVNADIKFPKTSENVLATSNTAQMTPILDRVISRFKGSDFLRDYIVQVNRTKGTLDFNVYGRSHRMHARIAGNTSENNLIGLHTPNVIVDEVQVFNPAAFTQLQPTINRWEPYQQIVAGVSNGSRNSILWQLDTKSKRFKRYKIPAPQNPYYSLKDFEEDLLRYGGEDSDDFQRLVLGNHGSAAFNLLNAEQITKKDYPFYSYRFSPKSHAPLEYRDYLKLPDIPEGIYILAIDCGFADPTLIQLFLYNGNKWELRARWRLTRVDFPKQEEIIHWIANNYIVSRIAIDTGAGGGGATIVHSLLYRQAYANSNYSEILHPVNFSEKITVGYAKDGNTFDQVVKEFASNDLVRRVESGEIVLSTQDFEGSVQLEHLAKQRLVSGKDRFFIMTDRGNVSEDDHIYASFVCFIMAIQTPIGKPVVEKKLGRPNNTRTIR